MIKKLPPWVEIGGFSLAFLAGCVNAVGLIGFKHQSVSHLSGTSSLLSLALYDREFQQVQHLSLIILSFVAGAVLSGIIIRNESLRLGRQYSLALLIEGVLLVLATIALEWNSNTGHYVASAACGLQNALVTTYSGAVIRTTHLTGLFTDLGIILGAWVRGTPPDWRKFLLYVILITGFVLGGVLASFSFGRLGFSTMLIPAFGAVALALANWIYCSYSVGYSSLPGVKTVHPSS